MCSSHIHPFSSLFVLTYCECVSNDDVYGAPSLIELRKFSVWKRNETMKHSHTHTPPTPEQEHEGAESQRKKSWPRSGKAKMVFAELKRTVLFSFYSLLFDDFARPHPLTLVRSYSHTHTYTYPHQPSIILCTFIYLWFYVIFLVSISCFFIFTE